ncbi:calcium:proton antiporter [Oleiphilus sp. HI0071]|uniref:calcium/sodium antiporter n=1 Tax=Oleiphilus sp. HI0079 TaxID=1822254 RepID=UPI0007C3EAC0|nr:MULTISPECIES: calcium/sodium antiporter [unclassified Oleiphilus]KZY59168.1 calcium:proton antiporter [Oleiphilus sp. HI0065]KZY78697.1 calcium:proton antiporter [Oleiphilus sp. HI0071]KZY96638.1 calcium:proton antiporter [Oleiphilus sp. HI0073]KZZ40853.1 calcium:proton antiporter [Oleiphilus sp. HI0118]KZZ50852.1 calcium:proton antiporter [Oleiphilus sp. HI0122]KZZ74163.1 calcium:proton antiporter [Oleiphilus sp. HI0133]KZZ75830.1 calcium:proton antiporter [Oleiphilus sp. HI0130]
MLVFSVALIVGLVILIWSADRFVEGAVSTALHLGMTPMLVGLTVVAFGTSAPELIVSAMAALQDSSNLAVGNAIGSNIANIALVLGLTTLVSAIPIKLGILRVELPILLIATSLATLVIIDGTIVFYDGLILSGLLIISLIALAKLSSSSEELPEEIDEASDIPQAKAYLYLIGSIVALVLSSRMLVWGASGIATELGVSDLIIGLTIVAIGTSLPELAASIASALKGHHDLALGNIIGSNLFNLLAVMAIPAFISPPIIDQVSLFRDYGFMLVLTFGLAILCLVNHVSKRDQIGKIAGITLLCSYIVYLVILYKDSVTALA